MSDFKWVKSAINYLHEVSESSKLSVPQFLRMYNEGNREER